MSQEVISLIVLVAMFVLATVVSVNMGVLGFVAAFLVGTLVVDLDADEILAGFPATCSSPWSASPTCSGSPRSTAPSTCWYAGRCGPWADASRPSRGSCSTLTAFWSRSGRCSRGGRDRGADRAGLRPALGISPLLMGMMVVHGALAGGFSPISVYGSFVNGLLEQQRPAAEQVVPRAARVQHLVGIVFVLLVDLRCSAADRLHPAPRRCRAVARRPAVGRVQRGGRDRTTAAGSTLRGVAASRSRRCSGCWCSPTSPLVPTLDVGFTSMRWRLC